MTITASTDRLGTGDFAAQLDSGPFLRQEGRAPGTLSAGTMMMSEGPPSRSPFPARAAASDRGLWGSWLARQFGATE
jgi:hypothetical protein